MNQSKPNPIRPLVAWRALRRLIQDPEDTAQVFEIIRAIGGRAIERGFRRFRLTPVGEKILREKINLVDTLKDREYLATLPRESLGQAYLHFTASQHLTADGLVDASEDHTEEMLDPNVKLYAERLRDMHDLWHTLTGYGRDELGEACLLAFTYAQTRNRGIALIVLFAGLEIRKSIGISVFRAICRGYRDGRKATWLPQQDFEALLKHPISEVRKELNINEPIPYRALLSDSLEAQAL